jgi:glycosyltransferase involved in cell wall biosynthesis
MIGARGRATLALAPRPRLMPRAALRRTSGSDGRVDPRHPLAGTAIAIIAAYNEAAVIGAQLDHAAEQGLGVYLIDNNSTDGTLEVARSHRGGSLVGFESYPELPSRHFESARLLDRKAEIAATLPSRWAVHVDADEYLEALDPGRTLADALTDAERAGCSAVRFRYVEFRPRASLCFPAQGDPRRLIPEYTLAGHPAHRWLTRAFRAGIEVDLASTGGHQAHFPGRRTYPWRQILRHYPVRDAAHATLKISRERRERYLDDERERGWHHHYDGIEPTSLLADHGGVERWDALASRVSLRADAVSEIEAEWIGLESSLSSPAA